jgi:hypothetical protein
LAMEPRSVRFPASVEDMASVSQPRLLPTVWLTPEQVEGQSGAESLRSKDAEHGA